MVVRVCVVIQHLSVLFVLSMHLNIQRTPRSLVIVVSDIAQIKCPRMISSLYAPAPKSFVLSDSLPLCSCPSSLISPALSISKTLTRSSSFSLAMTLPTSLGQLLLRQIQVPMMALYTSEQVRPSQRPCNPSFQENAR
jgi:hypothetical protein